MSCRVLHRGVEEALLAQVALESEMADLEQAWQEVGGFLWPGIIH